MLQHIDTIIVGGGQAGLSTSYYLKKQGREHVIFEKAYQPAQVWRNRWDSFTLITPSWMIRLPGAPYSGDNPDGFMSRDALVQYFEAYIEQYQLPVRFGVTVNSVEYLGDGYLVRTSEGDYKALNLVVACGLHQKPKVPPFSGNLSPNIHQLHSSQYKNPESLPPGAVLVVGSAQSGSQIAEELYQNGRKVFLSVSSAGRFPRRYRGRDANYWMEKMGYFARTVNDLKSPKDKFAPSGHGTGKDGGHTINLHQFAKDGVTLLGHVREIRGEQILLAPDLKEDLARADQFELNFTKEVDAYIESEGLNIPEESLPKLTDGFDVDEILELAPERAGITNVIWATGYAFDFSWINLPVFDQDGFPIQDCGVSRFPGLYFVGMTFLCTGISGLLAGVGDDARHIAQTIQEQSRLRPFQHKHHTIL
ncbi:MAG TPA: FAD-dependent oxidoreductase [Anaerolineaceae bacterium]|nr:FAD-dependent oxidoreductase [Anaerolineaceae bacterium]